MKSDVQTACPAEQNDEGHPLLIGLRALKANVLPGLVVQTTMIVLVVAYYYCEPASQWLKHLAEVKEKGGYGFSLVSGMVAGGLLPEFLALAIFQKWRWRRENLENLIFNVFFWGFQAVVVDAFYREQAWMFGSHVDLPTITKKVIVDQFLYNSIWAAPFGLAVYEWRNNGYRFAGLSRVMTVCFYKKKVFPALLATWGVWIPVVSMVYSLPSSLQFPLFSLAITFWVMIFSWMNKANR